MERAASRRVIGWSACVIGLMVIVANYFAFGWLGAPVMLAVEFTALVVASLTLIIARHALCDRP